MASKEVHLAQARHNEDAALQLKDTDFYDWGCTAAFYSALHYIEAGFNDNPAVVHTSELYKTTKGVRKDEDYKGGEHAFRAMLVGRLFPKAETAYRQLWNASNTVRYIESGQIATDSIKKPVAERLITGDLPKVKSALGL
jgi:hypothetical protein